MNLFAGIFGSLTTIYSNRVYRNIIINLNNHTVFAKIQETKLLILQIPWRSEFRKETITYWNFLVLDFQKKFCLDVLRVYNKESRWDFKGKIAKIAQERLVEFTEQLMAGLPEKIERKYSAIGIAVRNQLRDAVFHYCFVRGLTDKERVLGIFKNVEFFCSSILTIANEQNNMNGELKGIIFVNKEGKELED